MTWTLYHGDCLDILRTCEANSLDTVVTDPPYGLSNHTTPDIVACLSSWMAGQAYMPAKSGFMGKTWDAWVPGPEVWREVYRVLKPGGHMLVFAGTRSSDLMSIALRLAGFELRDCVMWVHGSGFPKGQDIGKAIDRMAGAEREVVGIDTTCRLGMNRNLNDDNWNKKGIQGAPITTPATPEAQQWDGWNTNLKPAYEPILLCRKPLDGTVAENARRWGVGGLNIDACRVPTSESDAKDMERCKSLNSGTNAPTFGTMGIKGDWIKNFDTRQGRYPANLIHDGSDEVLAGFPVTAPGKRSQRGERRHLSDSNLPDITERGHNDAGGTAARFFYCAKASKRERNAGLEGMPLHNARRHGDTGPSENAKPSGQTTIAEHNHHPTVKPQALMQYLCKLITPEGGTILDPFTGSGSTGVAAISLGYSFIGIEREADYVEIAKRRLEDAAGDCGIVEMTQETGEQVRRTVQQLSLFLNTDLSE